MTDSISAILCVRVCVWAAWFSGTCTELDTVGRFQTCSDTWVVWSVEVWSGQGWCKTLWTLMTLVGDL